MHIKEDFKFIRRRIKNKKYLVKLKELEENYKLVIEKRQVITNKQLFGIKIGNYKIWLRKGSSASSIMTYLEIFKEKVHMKLSGFTGKKESIIFDIGANEGFYTLAMKRNNPNLKIVSVEPAPSTFKVLKKNIISNHLKNIILINKILTSKKGKTPFEIVPEATAISATNITMQKRPWLDTRRIKKITINSTTLSDLCKQLKINHISILKLDVEGSELEILKSSKSLLKNIKKIVIEWHSKKLRKGCKEFLKKNGFKLVYEEKKKCGDLYFINKSFKP